MEKYNTIDRGIVKTLLDVKRRPVYAHAAASLNQTVSSKTSFNTFFTDTSSGKNLPISINLTAVGPGPMYSFSNNDWFPVDGKGWGNGLFSHNYHWCAEFHSTFGYRGGEKFDVCSDDDAWLFLNNNLVADLGGVHLRECVRVYLDSVAADIRIVKNNNYNFDLFFCNRKTNQSQLSFMKPAEINPICEL